MDRIIDRFDQYLQIKHISDIQATKDLGLSNGVIGKSRKENRELSKKVIGQIEKHYTDLDIVWLITGKGTMLKSQTVPQQDIECVKNRLVRFIKEMNLSQSRFEKSVGLSNGYVNNMRVSIQPKTLHKVSLAYPQLNTAWLLTGEGQMFKEITPKAETEDLREQLSKLNSQINELIRQNYKLIEIIDRLTQTQK